MFDRDSSSDEQLARVGEFLRERSTSLRCARGEGLLVFFIYIGHGTFIDAKSDYIVLLGARGHLENLPSFIRVADVAGLMEEAVSRSSRIIVLDSCFAGAAVSSFMSDPAVLEGIKVQQMLDLDPMSTGVSVLCAASKDDPAQFDDQGRYTLFGNAVLTVLWRGVPGNAKRLSLRRVCRDARNLLGSAALPTPEVHSPKQSDCDPADVDIFPNRRSPRFEWHTKYLGEAKPVVLSRPDAPPDVPAPPGSPEPTKPETLRSRGWKFPVIVVLAAFVVVGSLLAGGIPQVINRSPATEGFDTTLIGADADDRGCATDAQVLRATEDNPDFLLEIIWSAQCDTAWARTTWRGVPGLPEAIEARVYPKGHDPTGPDARVARKPNIGFVKTGMVERGSRGSVCAVGSVTVDGRGSPSPVELCG